MTIEPICIPADAFMTTWDHIYAVAGASCIAGMIGGAITLYVAQQVRIYLSGELMRREPRSQRLRSQPGQHGEDGEDGEIDEEVE